MSAAVAPYPHGVIERTLPGGTKPLKPQTALQDPEDYLVAMEKAVRTAVRQAGINPRQIAGIGTDFTSCTVLPAFADGSPLTSHPRLARNPHSWVKLWKHHSAQPQADRINETGVRRNEQFLRAYGGKYSSEWFFSKVLETLEEAPEIYKAADRFIEAGDWIVWQLCGRETRNIAAAGFKGMRVQGREDHWDYPLPDFFRSLNPELEHVIRDKISGPVLQLGQAAGELTAVMARRLGLPPGIPVAAGNIDAHSGVPASGVTEAGSLVMIAGTSTCHLLLADTRQEVEGICGVVQDGVVSGLWGYEAGQPAVGDAFAWFVDHFASSQIQRAAKSQKQSMHEYLSAGAARLKPGQSGLLALDWLNGNRSVLVDANLTGLVLGLNLHTRPEEIYRALIEATAFGTRKIVEAFDSRGIPINQVIACGGLPRRNPTAMQIYADVLQRPIHLAAAEEASALGSAIHAATAAGIYPTVHAAAKKMTRRPSRSWKPNLRHKSIYDDLYAEYSKLHDWFGRSKESPMKRLLEVQARSGAL